MLRAHSSFYHIATAALYYQVDMTTANSNKVFAGLILPTTESGVHISKVQGRPDKWPDTPVPPSSPSRERSIIGTDTSQYVPSIESHRRKLFALSWSHTIHLHSVPSSTLSRSLAAFIRMFAHGDRPSRLFPAVTALHLGPGAMWQLVEYLSTYSTRERPVGHPFTAVLAKSMNPRIVVVQSPNFARNRSRWIGSRLPGNDTPVDEARKQEVSLGWHKLLKSGLEATLSGVVRAWQPERFTLTGTIEAQPFLAGITNRVIFGHCHCVRAARARGSRSGSPAQSFVEANAKDGQDGVVSKQWGVCYDHVASEDRVRAVVRMCERAVAAERGGERNRMLVQIYNVGVSTDENETTIMIKAIREGILFKGLERKVILEFPDISDMSGDRRMESRPAGQL